MEPFSKVLCLNNLAISFSYLMNMTYLTGNIVGGNEWMTVGC